MFLFWRINLQIQVNIISKCLPDIVKKTKMKLNANVSELNNLPQKLSTVGEAVTIFMRIVGLSRVSLNKLLLRGEFDEYSDDKEMHCTARLAKMVDKFSKEMKINSDYNSSEKFLINEIEVLRRLKRLSFLISFLFQPFMLCYSLRLKQFRKCRPTLFLKYEIMLKLW